MVKMGVYHACSEYLIENFIHKDISVGTWKITDKSLVVYDFDHKRYVIPLKTVMDSRKDVPIVKKDLVL